MRVVVFRLHRASAKVSPHVASPRASVWDPRLMHDHACNSPPDCPTLPPLIIYCRSAVMAGTSWTATVTSPAVRTWHPPASVNSSAGAPSLLPAGPAE